MPGSIITLACGLLLATLVPPAFAQERGSVLPRVALEDDGSGAAVRFLDGAPQLEIPVAVRVKVDPGSGAPAAELPGREGGNVRLWAVIDVPRTADAVPEWRASLRRLFDRQAERLSIVELWLDQHPVEVAQFAAQVAAAEIGASGNRASLALGGPAMSDAVQRERIYVTSLAPDVDLLAIQEEAVDGAALWLTRIDPEAKLLVTGRQGGAPALVQAVLEMLGTTTAAESWHLSDLPAATVRALNSLGDLATHELTVIEDEAVGLTLRVDDAAPPAGLRHRVLFDPDTFATLLVYWGAVSERPLTASLRVPLAGTASVTDLTAGERAPAAFFARNEATERVTAVLPLNRRPMLVDFNEGATVMGEQSSVSAERALTVGEIISRHRRQQLAQDRAVHNYIADAAVRQFFRPTITDPGYDIVTENRYYVAGDGIEWEELSFSVNNRRWGTNRPAVPMVQPEKAFALPLQLRFDEGYRYRLAGTERVDGYDCYVVRFEPVRDDAALYRGTIWIDRRTFARIRVQAVQGGLTGMVLSNDETQHYAPVVTSGNQPVFLLKALTSRQIWLLAGRNIPLEKNVEFRGFRINDARFEEARAAARMSDRIMYRETPGGLRSYVKRGNGRVIVDRVTEGVKAMAIGTVIDPSYQFPLPIFGINYVDFAFGDEGTQLAMLFAGVLAAGNIQRPQLFGLNNLNASVDFFAIAAPSSDRVYTADGEREGERLLTWPLSTGLNLGWQVTPFQKWSLQYQLRFDGYVLDTTTSATFERPSSTLTNGIGGAWEYSRAGYTVALNAAWFTRARWRAWGDPDEGTVASTSRDYAKYSASISRDFLLDIFQKFNLNAAWFGGRDLDRFVRYQFGLFDTTRLHGVPAAARFGELAMARGSYSVNVFDQYRLDLFLEHGWGRDESREPWRRIPAVGGAFNLPGPWNTIVRADVGHSWLPERYSTLGSTTLQIMLLKPLR
jgi:hypothetical protein